MTPTRKRRLIAVGLVLVAVGIAAALTVMALSQNMTYLFSPSEVLSGHAPPGSAFCLGGVVLENSLHRDQASLTVAVRWPGRVLCSGPITLAAIRRR